MCLKFSARWAGRPEHALHSQAGGKKIAKNPRAGGVARKVSEEVRRLPMGDAGEDQFFDVLQQYVEGLALGRRIRRKRSANLSWLHLREHRKCFDAGMVVGDPVNYGVTMAAEFLGRHVEGFFVGH